MNWSKYTLFFLSSVIVIPGKVFGLPDPGEMMIIYPRAVVTAPIEPLICSAPELLWDGGTIYHHMCVETRELCAANGDRVIQTLAKNTSGNMTVVSSTRYPGVCLNPPPSVPVKGICLPAGSVFCAWTSILLDTTVMGDGEFPTGGITCSGLQWEIGNIIKLLDSLRYKESVFEQNIAAFPQWNIVGVIYLNHQLDQIRDDIRWTENELTQLRADVVNRNCTVTGQ